MQKSDGKKKQKCKNCEGKGTLKKGDKVVMKNNAPRIVYTHAHFRQLWTI